MCSELDELWSFAGSKENARWVWIALCRQTRQVVAYFVGDRSAQSARALRERIPPDYWRRATRSDFWLAYDEVFPWRTHRLQRQRRRAKPATSNAGTALCASDSGVSYAKPSRFPSATGCMNSPCVCSSTTTTFHSPYNHYPSGVVPLCWKNNSSSAPAMAQ